MPLLGENRKGLCAMLLAIEERKALFPIRLSSHIEMGGVPYFISSDWE